MKRVIDLLKIKNLYDRYHSEAKIRTKWEKSIRSFSLKSGRKTTLT